MDRKGVTGIPGQESSGGHRAMNVPAVSRCGVQQFIRHPQRKKCPLWIDVTTWEDCLLSAINN